jgi:hypothetical protein
LPKTGFRAAKKRALSVPQHFVNNPTAHDVSQPEKPILSSSAVLRKRLDARLAVK